MERVRLGSLGLTRMALAPIIVLGTLATLVTIARMAFLSSIVASVFLAHKSLGGVRTQLVLLAGAALAQASLVWLREVVAQRAATKAKATTRARLYARLLELGPAYVRGERAGALLATATDGIDRLDPYVSKYLPQVVLSVLAPLLIAGVVLSRDWLSGVVLVVTAPILPLLMTLVGSYAEVHVQGQWTALTRMHAHMLEAVQGLVTLTMFGRGPAERGRLKRIGQDYRDRTLQTLRYAFLSSLVLEFITAGAVALVAVTLGVRLLSGDISFERAFFVLLLTPEFYRPLRELGVHRHAAMEGRAVAAKLEEIMSVPAPARMRAAPAALPGGALTIEFRSVGYTYPRSVQPALRCVDLTLAAGTRTALVGKSGSGKSTLISLLSRFNDPDSGEILANGTPIHTLAIDDWRGLLAIVPQRPYLFAGTLRDNICLGRPNAGAAEIERAAELSGAAAFIERLPRGYETRIGERGARLAGGEAQRIAIARAFLKDAPILMLDEPTSSLDPLSETLIRDALASLMRDRTVLIVAHRLNTILNAEQIAVLAAGRVVESGTHVELLARGGFYTGLMRPQAEVAA